MNIFQEIQNRAIDYKQVLSTCEIDLKDHDTYVSVIVPVCGRTEFNKVLCAHFYRAIAYANNKINETLSLLPIIRLPITKLTVSLTIVEHSDQPVHKSICADWVNYAWIPKQGQPFNKCLAHNIGALLTKESSYFLFHDVDIMVPQDFFLKVMQNLRRGSYDAIQTFTKRRLQLCDHVLTNKILQGDASMDNVIHYPGHYHEAQPGAMGGSIFLTKELFFKTTFCPEIFHDYGLEDAFFWQCIDLLGKLGTCDAPMLELFHLNHDANRITKDVDWRFYNAFLALSIEEKKNFIKLMADNLNKYQHETECKNI